MSAAFRIGTIGRDVPLEVAEAAGARVVRLRGAAALPLDAADHYLGSGLDPAHRALLAGLLASDFAGLDAIVVSSDCDASQRVYYLLRELIRVQPELGVPPVHLVDVLHRPRQTSRQYTARVVTQFADVVATWTGVQPTAAALTEAIAARDDVRRRQRALLPLRREPQPRLDGATFQAVMLAGDDATPHDYAELLDAALSTAEQAPPHEGLRLALTGSSHDEPEVIRQVERAGSVVVADDHPEGELAIGPLVHEVAAASGIDDPLAAIAARWHANGPTPQRGSLAERAAHTAGLARAAAADAVLSYVREHDDAPLWDAAAQRRALDIPLAVVRNQRLGVIDAEQLGRAIDELRGAAHG